MANIVQTTTGMPQGTTRSTACMPAASFGNDRSTITTSVLAGSVAGSGTVRIEPNAPTTSRRASAFSSATTPLRVSSWSSITSTRTGCSS
jgi:hypothetical protein